MSGELSLQKDGIESVNYTHEEGIAVRNVAETWEEFRSLPLKEKLKLKADNLFDGVGYEVKVSNKPGRDRKEHFNYRRFSMMSADTLDRMNVSKRAVELVHALNELIEVSESSLENYWWRLQGNQPPDWDDVKLARKSARSVFIRCLYYPPGAEPGIVIAQPHTDHCGGTTHFYESTDGCEMLTLERRDWQPMPIHEHEHVRFAGLGAQMASKGEITALCHRVIANETSSEFGRSALVGFMPFVGFRQYDRARLGPIRNQVPGFNYDIDRDKLDTYFTP